MRVAELIAKLSTMDQDAYVVVPGYDHSYNPISYADEQYAEKEGNCILIQVDPDIKLGNSVRVVVIE